MIEINQLKQGKFSEIKFNIGEDVIIDKELERRLEDNDLNIDQTFQAMFG